MSKNNATCPKTDQFVKTRSYLEEFKKQDRILKSLKNNETSKYSIITINSQW